MSDTNELRAVKLTELLERCERATGPDRELDILLQNRFSPHPHGWLYRWGGQAIHPGSTQIAVLDFEDQDGIRMRDYLDDPAAMIIVPAYTKSIDAAVSLVEKVRGKGGWSVDPCFASVFGSWPQARATAATPALSLITALLRALSTSDARAPSVEEGKHG